MTHETAYALVCDLCPAEAGRLWLTTDHPTGCDTAWAVADQYGTDESDAARAALTQLAAGQTPDGWEPAIADAEAEA